MVEARPLKDLDAKWAANDQAAINFLKMVYNSFKRSSRVGRFSSIYYDARSNPSTVPGVFTKLIDVDTVDLVRSGYATNMAAPAMPIVMGHGLIKPFWKD